MDSYRETPKLSLNNTKSLLEGNIDQELLPIFQGMPALGSELDLKEIRKTINKNRKRVDIDTNVIVESRICPGLYGAPDVSCRIYWPRRKVQEFLPAIVWIHGGGFFIADVQKDDMLCQRFVRECNCVVISVDYRVAPENPYPAGLNDCYAALKWLIEKGKELSIDNNRIAIGGMSAGGCLAAGLRLRVRDEVRHAIACQILMIPVLDDRHKTRSSFSVTDPRVWNRELSLKAWAAYLGKNSSEPPVFAVRARATDLSRLPPSIITVEDQDLLRDEGIIYAQRLMQAGVRTELHVYPGTFHGSVVLDDTVISRRHLNDICLSLRKALWSKNSQIVK